MKFLNLIKIDYCRWALPQLFFGSVIECARKYKKIGQGPVVIQDLLAEWGKKQSIWNKVLGLMWI